MQSWKHTGDQNVSMSLSRLLPTKCLLLVCLADSLSSDSICSCRQLKVANLSPTQNTVAHEDTWNASEHTQNDHKD